MSETKKKTAAPKPVSKKPYLTGKPLDSSCIGGGQRCGQRGGTGVSAQGVEPNAQ